MARAERKPRVVFHSTEGPTSDRIRHSGGFFELAGEDRSSQKYTMQDSPLAKLRARDAIEPKEYSALLKYAHHWYHGGLQGSVSSMDLNRVFASDPLSMSGMAKSEGQAHHRQQYREAREMLGLRARLIDAIVCEERTLEVAGYSIGWRNRPQAVAAATEILRDAGYRLARLWGM